MKPIRITQGNGELIARDSFLLAFFCKRPAADLVEAFSQVFDHWLDSTPAEAKKWAMIGENATTYKPFASRSMKRLKAEFDAKRAASKEISAFELGGPQQINPDHQIVVILSRDVTDDDPETNLLEIRLPSEEVTGGNVERVVDFARSVAERIPYDSGYGSLALTCGVDSQLIAFAETAQGLAIRHPGFDMPKNDPVRIGLDKQLRGAYWLTFVGADALHKLGGPEILRAELDSAITMEPLGTGVMLRVGERPEIGDVNRGDNLPLIRSLAKVLQPVMRFGDRFLNNLFLEEEDRERWERRHLD